MVNRWVQIMWSSQNWQLRIRPPKKGKLFSRLVTEPEPQWVRVARPAHHVPTVVLLFLRGSALVVWLTALVVWRILLIDGPIEINLSPFSIYLYLFVVSDIEAQVRWSGDNVNLLCTRGHNPSHVLHFAYTEPMVFARQLRTSPRCSWRPDQRPFPSLHLSKTEGCPFPLRFPVQTEPGHSVRPCQRAASLFERNET